MPRPLLEIWREQNRDRDREPSLLLTVPSHEALRRMQQNAPMERLRTFAQTAPAREMHQAMRQVAERLMGRMRPVSPGQPDKPKPKRKPGAGRHRSLMQDQIDKGISILRDKPKMSVKAARRELRKAGIDASDTSLYDHVIRPATFRK
jgi:hypothetical protein